jgi:type VI secretion system secreted protein VgrG
MITYGPKHYESLLNNSFIVFGKIVIDREEVLEGSHFSFKVTQKVADHDFFEIICHVGALEERNAYPLDATRNYLGEKILIKLKQKGQDLFNFNGIITSLKTTKTTTSDGDIIISGYAPTILLENGLECVSYERKSLRSLVEATAQGYMHGMFKFLLKPNYTQEIPYMVQYRETDYQFIKRLAARYGEWFYYNGREIVFGNHDEGIVELEQHSEMFEYELKMEVIPQNFTYVTYEADQGQHITRESNWADKKRYPNDMHAHAIKASENVYQKKPMSLYNHSLLEDGEREMMEVVQRQKDKRANVFFVEVKSNKCELKVGSLVKLTGLLRGDRNLDGGKIALETYRITEISHFYDKVDGYYNTFKGVPREITIPHYASDDAFAICEEQSGEVTDNNDPQGLGRIRVQFPWQKYANGESTPWIRMTNPHSGSGKGMYFIPEIGEEVLVTFENRNAEKPVVLGTMYNGKQKSGFATPNNDFKVTQTRTGIKIVMNDASKSMLLEDPSGNKVFMDGKGSIDITAPNRISLTCTDMDINVSKSLTTTVGINKTESVGLNSSETVGGVKNSLITGDSIVTVKGALTELIEGDVYSEVKKDRNESSIEPMNITSEGNINKHSKTEIQNNSGEKSKMF